jgi:release factor glutamine methyltransferase
MTVEELLQHTAQRLAAPELVSEDPRQEARELLAHALGTVPAKLRGAEMVDPHAHGEFMRLLARRLESEPTGYIVGAVEIDGLRFKVDRRGFIPRLDLPVLIHAGLAGVAREATGFALDLACGIGAAGICVGHARPGLQVDLADVSAEAIELARENAELLIPGRAHAYAGDLFEPLPRGRRYAIITANPPWVPDGTELPEEVLNEPHVSFFGGPDGLDIVRAIIRDLPGWMAPGGIYAQECDPSQVEKVLGLLVAAGLHEPKAHADKEGVQRVVSARKP